MNNKKIAIIGGGPWGDALASVFARDSGDIIQFSRNANKNPISVNIKITNDFSDLKDRDYILMVVPAQKTRDCCAELKKHIGGSCSLIICSKGIEVETGKLLSEVASEYFPKESVSVLSGPNFAKEIIDQKPAMSSLASYNTETARQIASDLSNEKLNLYPTDNIVAVQIFGALKNVLAILCGFARGLSFGENEMSALIVKGISEIGKMASERGNVAPSLVAPGCIGDVILTCTSKTSRNTRYGMSLSNKTLEKQSGDGITQTNIEGIKTIMALSNLDLANYPLLDFSVDLLSKKHSKTSSLERKFRNLLFS